jgi:hypothetical protein
LRFSRTSRLNCFLTRSGMVAIPDADTEIIDRVLTAKKLIGRPVSIVTGDGNMHFNAVVAALGVIAVET